MTVFIISPKGAVSLNVPFTGFSMGYFTASMLFLTIQNIPSVVLDDYECVELSVDSGFVYMSNNKTCRINSDSYSKVLSICPCDVKKQRLLKLEKVFGRMNRK